MIAPEIRLRRLAERRERSVNTGASLIASRTLSVIQTMVGKASCQERALKRMTDPAICITKRGMDWKADMICCCTAEATCCRREAT
ncbi:hypothetical protein D3C87_1777940 [compost metagenome]